MKSTMTQNLRKLQLISRFINLDWFYSIEISDNEIKFQGDFTQAKHEALRRWFNFKLEDGMMKSNVRNQIRIVLS